MKKNYPLILVVTILILCVSFVLSLCLGAEKISLESVFSSFSSEETEEINFDALILFELRLPRTLLAMLTGMLLAGSGAVFQMFFRNPLAEPSLMGISSGATLGAVLAQCFGLSVSFAVISSVNIMAFVTAMMSSLVILAVSFSSKNRSSMMVLLCGTALGTLYSSVSSIIILSTDKELHSIYTWILGSFNGRGWNELLFILFPALLSFFMMFLVVNRLDLLSGGSTSALSLGVDVGKMKYIVLISGSLAVSSSVCAGGTIGFVGLIAPHIVRKILSPKGKILIPFSILFGGILLVLSDTVARCVIAPSELPAGVITSVMGVPFFLSMITGKDNK